MKIQRLASALLLLSLPLSALADYKIRKITGNELRDTISRLSDYEAANVLITKGDKLGGKCKAVVSDENAYYISAKIANKALNIGKKEVASTTTIYKEIKILWFKIKIPVGVKTVYKKATPDQADQWKKELGSEFKKEIADVNWLCGSNVSMQTRSIRTEELFAKIEFYEEEGTGKVICKGPNINNQKVRNPETCKYDDVMEELPEALCKYMERLARKRSQEMIFAGTTPQKKPKRVFKLPVFRPLTAAIKSQLMIARAVRSNPHLATFLETAGVESNADSYLPSRVHELLNNDVGAADFSALSADDKLEIARTVVTVEAYNGSSDHDAFSPELVQFAQAMKPQIESFTQDNNLQPAPFLLPERAEIADIRRHHLRDWEVAIGHPIQINKCDPPIIRIKPAPKWLQISRVPVKPILLDSSVATRLRTIMPY